MPSSCASPSPGFASTPEGAPKSAPESAPAVSAVFAAGSTVAVLLPIPPGRLYRYQVPEGMTVSAGAWVVVPLGKRQVTGVVWGAGGDFPLSPSGTPLRLRPLQRCHEAPPLTAAVRRFVDWVADYTLTPAGLVLRMTLGAPEALEPPNQAPVYGLSGVQPAHRLTPERRRVVAALVQAEAAGQEYTARELAAAAGCGLGVINGLVAAGWLEARAPDPAVLAAPALTGAPFALSGDQQQAVAGLTAAIAARRYQTVLLDGVTGSGKTAVFLEAVAACCAQGRQALILLPEIALTRQTLERCAARFGTAPAVWHSGLAAGRRRRVWRGVAQGSVPLVVGARSALFLPFSDLGLIVVDEEHDPSYKQEDGVLYHARDMAVVRAWVSGIPAVLVSATPSLETRINAERGRYAAVHLPLRHGGASLPQVERVDLRRHPPPSRAWLSPPLRQAMAEALSRQEQVLLFLNRRGYAPLTVCRTCGHRFQCSQCTAWLVEHRRTGHLHCHHCGHRQPLPERCPACDGAGPFAACGPGVERIAEEAASLFPQARLAVLASDTLPDPEALQTQLQAISNGERDILVGTQMMAKGHHFPALTLVGVVDADLGLDGGDPRAAERTFQMLHQVAGRAGRAERPGRVLLQTWMPEHPVMRALAAGDRDGFFALEAERRQRGSLPPYGRLVALILSGDNPSQVEHAARQMARAAPPDPRMTVLGPAPAPLALLRGRFRYRLLVMSGRDAPLHPWLRQWLAAVALPSAVRLQVDVDPQSFM